jgi:multidrug efflux pump subunit AcrB
LDSSGRPSFITIGECIHRYQLTRERPPFRPGGALAEAVPHKSRCDSRNPPLHARWRPDSLEQIASGKTAEGASFIYREGLVRYVPVRFAMRGRVLQSTVLEAKRAVAVQVMLPEGVHLEWAGEYGELQQANCR